MSKISDFELLGHDCPLGIYPSPVVPIGRINGQLVSVYLQPEYLNFLDQDFDFVRHSPTLNAKLQGFRYLEDRLFAYSSNNVLFYNIDEENEFFRNLLSDSSFATEIPFMRLSLAKAIKDPDIAIHEILSCINNLMKSAPGFVNSWYAGQLESFEASGKPTWINLPESWQELFPSEKGTHPLGLKTLIIDNDKQLVRDISFCLQVRYPELVVISVAEGSKGIEMVATEPFDFVFAGTSLPDIETLDLIVKIRDLSKVPLIVLSEGESDIDKDMCLEVGADEYIIRPFSPVGLLARVKALLRRTQGFGFKPERFIPIGGDLTINSDTHEVLLAAGKRVKLTPIEYHLLLELVRNNGRVLTHSNLVEKVWGSDETYDNSCVTRYIYRLRSKLEADANKPQMLLTERGKGYKFQRAI